MSHYIFLDRDGVINQDSMEYIKTPEEFIFVPGSLEALVRLAKAGFTVGVATNQSGVSRKLYTEATLKQIHAKLINAVKAAGGEIAAIEYCIHLPTEGCTCRKPQPGMLHALAKRFDCSLTEVSFIGDRVSDIQAAKAAGANPIMVLSPMTDITALQAYPEVPVFNSLAEYVVHLIGRS